MASNSVGNLRKKKPVFFQMPEDEPTVQDIEDGPKPSKIVVDKQITAKVNKRKRTESPVQDPLTWQDAFGRPPSIGTSRVRFL